jgi:hypothetical protein
LAYDDIEGDPTESRHDSITAYLFDGSGVADPHLVVGETSEALSSQPKLIIGTKPIDDGNYIFDAEQRKDFLRLEPRAGEYMRPFVGSEEFINGGERWILYLEYCVSELRLPSFLRSCACGTGLNLKYIRHASMTIHMGGVDCRHGGFNKDAEYWRSWRAGGSCCAN